MGSVEDFEPILDQLAQHHRVTAVDRPGFGLSLAHGDDPTYPGNARLLGGLIRALGLERPVIVGHSHGGGVALRLAEVDPNVAGGLVLLAPASYPSDDGRPIDRLLAVPYLGEGVLALLGPFAAPETIAAILEPMIAPDRARVPPDFVSYRQDLWSAPRSLAVNSRQQVSDVAGLTEIAAGLRNVRAPTTVIGCSQDVTEGHGVDSRRLARELPAASLVWLEGCGHYIQYARPDDVIAAIRAMALRAQLPTPQR
jgi:pimeloyl-ACP methyl ester carboxylesterase